MSSSVIAFTLKTCSLLQPCNHLCKVVTVFYNTFIKCLFLIETFSLHFAFKAKKRQTVCDKGWNVFQIILETFAGFIQGGRTSFLLFFFWSTVCKEHDFLCVCCPTVCVQRESLFLFSHGTITYRVDEKSQIHRRPVGTGIN